jgi:hypothetical protein
MHPCFSYLSQGSAGNEAMLGATVAVHTFGEFQRFNPHQHVIATDGCFSDTVTFSGAPTAQAADRAATTISRRWGNRLCHPRPGARNWARLIQKIYEGAPLLRPNCHGAIRIIAFIEEQPVIQIILSHLGL